MNRLLSPSAVERPMFNGSGVLTGAQIAVAHLPSFNEAISTIDNAITEALKSRDAVSLRIGTYKKNNDRPILDTEREEIVRNDMFQYLKIRAHAVSYVGKMNTQSDNLWNAIMAYSRSIQESAEPSRTTDTIELLRMEIDSLNRSIVELVAERMKLFASQSQIEGHGVVPIHSKSASDSYFPVFTELDGLCMAGRGARLPVGNGGWSSD